MIYFDRKFIRLEGYDYSQNGLYFVTICTQNREHLFGSIDEGIMYLNDAGKMVQMIWNEIPIYYTGFRLHEFVIMPNHIHGIIEIIDGQMGLGDIVHRFKTLTTTKYITGVRDLNWEAFDKRVWQRNYHEHIIRNEKSYLKISQYVQTNPKKWHDDIYHP